MKNELDFLKNRAMTNRRKRMPLGKRILYILLIYIPLFFLITSISAVIVFKYVPVKYTPLMAIRSFEHRKNTNRQVYKKWTPISEIAPEMMMSVMILEDMRFIAHSGFDLIEIRKARQMQKSGQNLRGASTISQQTAKNVFLLPHRSWVRKALEAYFTVWIELIWGKKRILEVYLNVAEMGENVYGVEAAAQYYYQKPAKELSLKEAALMAACLPDPLQRKPLYPSQTMEERTEYVERTITQYPVRSLLEFMDIP